MSYLTSVSCVVYRFHMGLSQDLARSLAKIENCEKKMVFLYFAWGGGGGGGGIIFRGYTIQWDNIHAITINVYLFISFLFYSKHSMCVTFSLIYFCL